MNLPAAADGAYLCVSSAMAWTTVATGVTRLPVRTAPLASSPVGGLTPVCPGTSCVMAELTAETGRTSLRSCVVCLGHALRLLPRALCLSFSVETGSASARPGGVTTHQTALMAATRTTVVSDAASETKENQWSAPASINNPVQILLCTFVLWLSLHGLGY